MSLHIDERVKNSMAFLLALFSKSYKGILKLKHIKYFLQSGKGKNMTKLKKKATFYWIKKRK